MQTILTDLMETSERIENVIDDMLSSATQPEFDKNITTDTLINTAFETLLELLEENGIIFHTDDIGSVRADRYSMSYIIFLYKFFNTINVINHIKNTPKYYDNISAQLVDTPDEQFIVEMMRILAETIPSSFHIEAYTYLQDKIISNQAYARFIGNAIDILAIQSDNSFLVFDDNDRRFIDKLVDERKFFNKCILDLIYKGALPIDQSRMNRLGERFCSVYSIPDNIKILSNYESLYESNTLVMDSFMQKIHTSSDLHENYYSNSDLGKLSLGLIIGIILGKIADFHLFGIAPDYDRLIKFGNSDVPIKSIIEMIPDI